MATSSRMGFPCVSAGKESTCIVGDLGLIPGLGRSHGEVEGYPLQYSGLENSLDCVGWWERLIVGKIGTCFNGRGHAQSIFNPIFCWWVKLYYFPVVSVQFTSVHWLSHVWLCDPMDCNTPGLPVHHSLLEFTQAHVHWIRDVIQLSHPLSSLSPPAFNLSQHQGPFKWTNFQIMWPKYWHFSFSISLSNEYLLLISFRMEWLDLRAIQGNLKHLLQHHSSKLSVLQYSSFLIVQVSHPCMTTGKTIALTRWFFVGKDMSLLFNMLSSLVITFLPRSKCL